MYDIQIKKLEFIIENWELMKFDRRLVNYKYTKEFGKGINFVGGLCVNCDFCNLDGDFKWKMFNTFPKYSGHRQLPLSNFEKFYALKNYTDTPERLELAIHCLKFLKKLTVKS